MCFCLTKSAQKKVKALGGCLQFPDCLRVGAGAGVSVGGKRVTVDYDEAVGFDRSDVVGKSSEVSINREGVEIR
jgi:hypothetical protein